jgi:hypothetical protein
MKVLTTRKYEKGAALIVALFFIMILTVIGLSLLFNTSLDNVISNNYSKTVRATYTATSGVERFKAYLLYDFKHDPKQWSNRYLVVPAGSTYVDGTVAPSDSAIGGSGSDGYFDLGHDPSTTPYKIDDNIPFVKDLTMYAELPPDPSHPIVTPGSGYFLMLRNVPIIRGTTCSSDADCDPTNIFVMAMGRTTVTKAYLNSNSKGTNLIEDGIFGDDISVWNNIFFADDNDLSGGGSMTIHGNIHTLGTGADPDDIVFDTKANVVNSYYMVANGQGRLEDPLRSVLSTPQQRDPSNINNSANRLGAKFRVRNGLANLQGSAYVGTSTVPFDVIATCRSCGQYANGFTAPTPDIHAARIINYNVPQSLQALVAVPSITNAYKDTTTNINYPTYTDYFVGMKNFGGTTFNIPGVLALKFANALGPDVSMVFREDTDSATNLAGKIWTAKDELFCQNVTKVTGSSCITDATEQRPLDPLSEADPLFSPTIGVGPTDGKTFFIVAADTSKNVFIVYKEVAPFQRAVDLTPADGVSTTTTVDFPRAVHGLVFAPYGTDMSTLALTVDLDGQDIEQDGTDYSNTLNSTDSNKLVRRVANALWRAGRGECGVLAPCYSATQTTGPSPQDVNLFWEHSMSYNNGANSRIYDTATNFLKITPTSPEDTGNPAQARKGKLIAFGGIETTDCLTMGDSGGGTSNGIIYAGRFTLFARDSNAGGACVGRVDFADNVYSIASYQFPTGSNPATYVAFPCQNNMGIMTSNDIDHSVSPHDEFGGSFFAQGQIHLTKQEQIIGAMVAGGWTFEAGGTPDFYQAMEISRCLPPYIIAKDPIVYADSQSWLER